MAVLAADSDTDTLLVDSRLDVFLFLTIEIFKGGFSMNRLNYTCDCDDCDQCARREHRNNILIIIAAALIAALTALALMWLARQ